MPCNALQLHDLIGQVGPFLRYRSESHGHILILTQLFCVLKFCSCSMVWILYRRYFCRGGCVTFLVLLSVFEM